MGYMRHHAIVVASWKLGLLEAAHAKAESIFKWVSPISPQMVNRFASFFIPPDGSKEGWDESNEGDVERDRFIEWLNTQRYEDGSTALDFVEVQFGDDDGE